MFTQGGVCHPLGMLWRGGLLALVWRNCLPASSIARFGRPSRETVTDTSGYGRPSRETVTDTSGYCTELFAEDGC